MFLIPDRHALRRLRHDLALVIPGLPLTLFAALMLLPLIAVSAALSIIWVGVLLLLPTLMLASAWARLDRPGCVAGALWSRPRPTGPAGRARRACCACCRTPGAGGTWPSKR